MRSRSRIANFKERQAKRNIFLSLFGIVGVLIILIIFGIPFLVNFSLFVEKKMDTKSVANSTTDSYVAPPGLDIPYTATNSATINVDTTGQEGQTISLYVNNSSVDEQDVGSNGTVTFKNVHLQGGENQIFAVAKENNHTSDDSETSNVNYLKNPPDLTVDSPSDGQTYHNGDSRTITISGKTAPDARVTVNGFWAVMQSDGSYHYQLNLQDGDTQIKIISSDEANNQTEKDIKVTYSP